MKPKNAVVSQMRRHADYFLTGPWPQVVQGSLPEGIFDPKKRYALAIVQIED